MTSTEDLIADSFGAATSPKQLAELIDVGVFNAAKMVEVIYELVVYAAPGKVDVDKVAASTKSLIAYMGLIGVMVDQLKPHVARSNRLK